MFLPVYVFAGEQGDDNPTGVAGAFNGSITTAGSYDPYTGNVHRQIDDIVVPGSVGAYPLKWTRYWNSHVTWGENTIGAKWRFSYVDWGIDETPDGRQLFAGDYGNEEEQGTTINGNGAIVLPDGGKVVFANVAPAPYIVLKPAQMIDPYGQITTMS